MILMSAQFGGLIQPLRKAFARPRTDSIRGSLYRAAWFLGVALVSVFAASGQQQQPPLRPPHPILLPQANNLPDANGVMVMNEQNGKKQNFDAANAARKRQMDDESNQLLILAKDLSSRMEKIGDGPLPPSLVREAEIIELLAHDLKEKMKMTVGGS
jgi:hypothetical protein